MKYIYFLLVALFFQGCSTNEYTITSNSIAGHNVIIKDAISTMRRYYSPARTTLVILPKEESTFSKALSFLKLEETGTSHFSKQFITKLRKTGYGVSTDGVKKKNKRYIPLSFDIDKIGKLTRITITIKKRQYSRVYKNRGNTLVAYSPITTRRLKKAKK